MFGPPSRAQTSRRRAAGHGTRPPPFSLAGGLLLLGAAASGVSGGLPPSPFPPRPRAPLRSAEELPRVTGCCTGFWDMSPHTLRVTPLSVVGVLPAGAHAALWDTVWPPVAETQASWSSCWPVPSEGHGLSQCFLGAFSQDFHLILPAAFDDPGAQAQGLRDGCVFGPLPGLPP